jgi:Zn-dependent M28 family amino/carboxypeptidase
MPLTHFRTAIHILSLALTLGGGACQTPQATCPPSSLEAAPFLPPAVEGAAKAITPEFLRAQITKISSDEFLGRGPATTGDWSARAYLSQQLAALGVEPGRGSEGWEQPLELMGMRTAMPSSWTFEHGPKTLSLSWSDQYIASSGVQTKTVTIEHAEVVFVGYGIQAPEYGWDDFKGRDVKGKVLLMMNNDPDWDPVLFAGTTRLYYGRWTYKYESAARHGAAGAIIIHTTPSAGYPFQVIQTSRSGEQFELPSSGEPTIEVKGWVIEQAARALVELAGHDLTKLIEAARSKSFVPVPLGITTSLRFENRVVHTRSANVYGTIKGSDPSLADEYVVVSAHHDHLGVGKPDAKGDAIYNGALDNATGDAQALAIAKALKTLATAPRRSVIVLFVGAEEQGLLGSKYFAEHPPVPPGKIAANVNYDGGNIWGRTRDIVQIGKGKSSIDEVVARIAARQGRTVKLDQFPDRGAFYRSDQFSFAKIGVPALYLKTGTDFVGRPDGWGKQQMLDYEAHRYHQPSDQIAPDWSFEGMVQDAQFGFFAVWLIANADQMPSWVSGDEFESARKAALAGVRR